MAITIAQAEANLAAWMAASEAIAGGKQHTIGSRSVTLADADEVMKMINYWSGWVNRLSRGSRGMRMRGVTPMDVR
jgi:hypothetical protein